MLAFWIRREREREEFSQFVTVDRDDVKVLDVKVRTMARNPMFAVVDNHKYEIRAVARSS